MKITRLLPYRLPVLALFLMLAGCDGTEVASVESQITRPAKILTIANESDDIVLEFSARIEALQTIDLSFEVGGPLAELPILEGETLARGALVAALDPTEFRLAVQEAEVQLKLAAQDLNRKRKVLKDNGIAKSQVEDARSNYELMKVRLSKARERYDDSKIHAPFKAYVSQRYFDAHVNVRAGDPIARLHDLSALQVVFNVPEEQLATVGPDRLLASWAEFSFADGERFEMQFHQSRGEADAVAQTFEVSFTMANPADWNILPGMTTTANIHLKGQEQGQSLIPASALVPNADDSLSVWLYDPETQQVKKVPVETGAPRPQGIPILSGLMPGDQIVITGANQLQAGMRVRPL
ncbi:MAG: RND family efflux transporter MFP subunit [Candidatus Azotimanducaceae bacterium]|jgi:RND family efflux transporter MFP subunit